MKTIQATVEIGADRRLTIQLPDDVPAGSHHVVVQIHTADGKNPADIVDQLPKWDVGPWPADLSLRREDMYGDDGR